MLNYYAKLSCYTLGGAVASTSALDAVLVYYRPGTDGLLAGDITEQSVPRARISFTPATGDIGYSRETSSSRTEAGALTVSPDYEYKFLGSETPTDAEARSLLAYTTFNGTFGEIVDGSQSFATTTSLTNGANQFLGVQYNDFSNSYYGWIKYSYVGSDVRINTIVFETDPDVAAYVGVIPESSTNMAIAGGLLSAGLIGIRKLRKAKQAQAA